MKITEIRTESQRDYTGKLTQSLLTGEYGIFVSNTKVFCFTTREVFSTDPAKWRILAPGDQLRLVQE